MEPKEQNKNYLIQMSKMGYISDQTKNSFLRFREKTEPSERLNVVEARKIIKELKSQELTPEDNSLVDFFDKEISGFDDCSYLNNAQEGCFNAIKGLIDRYLYRD
jgi:hypothetical protein